MILTKGPKPAQWLEGYDQPHPKTSHSHWFDSIGEQRTYLVSLSINGVVTIDKLTTTSKNDTCSPLKMPWCTCRREDNESGIHHLAKNHCHATTRFGLSTKHSRKGVQNQTFSTTSARTAINIAMAGQQSQVNGHTHWDEEQTKQQPFERVNRDFQPGVGIHSPPEAHQLGKYPMPSTSRSVAWSLL